MAEPAAPRVSVILPTYNRAAKLGAAIDSVLMQDFRDFELIVVDDASGDDTANLVGGIGDARIRLLRHEKNRGAAAARNTGLQAARGEVIAFQDSDDEWLPGRLTLQMRLFERLPAGFGIVTGAILRPLSGGRDFRADWSSIAGPDGLREVTFETIAGQFWAQLQTMLVRRSCFAAVGEFDERLHGPEDWDMSLRLARVCRIADCGAVVARLRYSADSLTHRVDLTAPSLDLILGKFEGQLSPALAARLARMTATRYCLNRQPQRAAELLRRSLALQPRDAGTRLLLGLVRVAPWASAAGVRFARWVNQWLDTARRPSRSHPPAQY